MAGLKGFDFLDLGGGLNEGQPLSAVNPNEATILRNFYPFGRKLVRRGGVRKITTAGNWDENIFSMFPLNGVMERGHCYLVGQPRSGSWMETRSQLFHRH